MEIDRDLADVHVSPITEFPYLKELLEPKVRARTEGLPFTAEGYERAKNILKTKVWKGKRNCQRTRYQRNATSSHL